MRTSLELVESRSKKGKPTAISKQFHAVLFYTHVPKKEVLIASGDGVIGLEDSGLSMGSMAAVLPLTQKQAHNMKSESQGTNEV